MTSNIEVVEKLSHCLFSIKSDQNKANTGKSVKDRLQYHLMANFVFCVLTLRQSVKVVGAKRYEHNISRISLASMFSSYFFIWTKYFSLTASHAKTIANYETTKNVANAIL
jgi:hypothetical protein